MEKYIIFNTGKRSKSENDFEKDFYNLFNNEILMDSPIYLGFAVLELSKLFMYETYYDKPQPYFGRENLQLHYMDCDRFVLRVRTQNLIIDLKNFEDLFGLSG